MNNLTKFEEKEMDILADIDYLKQKLGTLHNKLSDLRNKERAKKLNLRSWKT